MKVAYTWPPRKTQLWEDLQALGTDSTLLPLTLWDCSPCRSSALPLWSVQIFLTDEFAHYICEAICGSVGTAPVSHPLQCVVLLLAHRNIRLLSLTLTSISLLGPFLNRWRLQQHCSRLWATVIYIKSPFSHKWRICSEQWHAGGKTRVHFWSENQGYLLISIQTWFSPGRCVQLGHSRDFSPWRWSVETECSGLSKL